MADKEKLQEERKTGGPKMLRPGLGPQGRGPQGRGKEEKGPFNLPKDQKIFIMLDGKKYEVEKMAKGGRAGYKSGSKGCKLAMKGKGRAYGKNS